MRLKTFHSPGWYGLRTGRLYWVLRDVRRHRHLFTERNGSGGKCLRAWGSWEFWCK